MINILPQLSDFEDAEATLGNGRIADVDCTYFQYYIALIATCVRRGHSHVSDIMAQIAPIVGSKNAEHLVWLIDILSGPANDVHLWDWNGPAAGKGSYGPDLFLHQGLATTMPPAAQ